MAESGGGHKPGGEGRKEEREGLGVRLDEEDEEEELEARGSSSRADRGGKMGGARRTSQARGSGGRNEDSANSGLVGVDSGSGKQALGSRVRRLEVSLLGLRGRRSKSESESASEARDERGLGRLRGVRGVRRVPAEADVLDGVQGRLGRGPLSSSESNMVERPILQHSVAARQRSE